VVDDGVVQAGDAAGHNLVLISGTTSASTLNTTFRDVSVPVMLWQRALFDDMDMIGTQGTMSGQTQVNVINSAHPLAAGLSGNVTILTTGKKFTWGIPSGNAIVVAELSSKNKPVIFGYEAGAGMISLTAPARRLAFVTGDSLEMTPDGWALFDAAIKWSLACLP
jgi:hypothetical protein